MSPRFLLGTLACLFTACATGKSMRSLDDGEKRASVLDETARDPVVAAAKSYVGTRLGADCTGLVRAIFEKVHVDLLSDAQPGDNGVSAIYRFAQARGRVFTGGHALPGDLVFFRDTYEKNGNELTHVGIVEDVDAEGTVSVIHRVHRGVVRYRMNLAHPDARTDPRTGQAINDYLRPAAGGQPARLAGELFAAYATLFTAEPIARR